MFSADTLEMVRHIRGTAPPIDLRHPIYLFRNLYLAAQMMKASEPLLELAISLLPDTGFEMELRFYYQRHLEEERGHLAWLMDDLNATDTLDLRDWSAAAVAGSQYYMIRHQHPAALLGYMLVLEAFPMSLEAIAELEGIHGARVMRCLRYHAEHDVDHGADLLKILDRVPCHLNGLIYESAQHTALILNQAQKMMIEVK